MQQILPFGGRGKAEQAMKRSVSIFTNSKIVHRKAGRRFCNLETAYAQ